MLRACLMGAALVFAGACGGPRSSALHVLDGPTMGAAYTVKIAAPAMTETGRKEVHAAIEKELALIDELMSTYRQDSELSAFNRHAEAGPFRLSPLTFEVFRLSLEISRLTGGAFDVTVAPLVNAWGFGPPGPVGSAPSDEDIERLRPTVGFHLLLLDEEARAVSKLRPDVEADFNGIAPGFAIDRLAELLETRGFRNYLVELGGELRGSGAAENGAPWRVAIERPSAGVQALSRVIPLADAAIATSGDYRNYQDIGGERVSHVIDPRTGRPVRHRLASATVVDRSCARADALSTALMVMGRDEALAFARREGIAALLISRAVDGALDERTTPAFDALLASSRFD
jgi:thiamine biosynthesis lipoprotein